MLPFEEPTLAELLNEPIVRKLMARDRVTERQVCAIAIAARCRIENLSHADLPTPLAFAAGNAAAGGLREGRLGQRV
jgi:hypothetical protein